MSSFVENPDATAVYYKDTKRWLWLIGGMWTLGMPFSAALVYFLTDKALWTVFILPVHLFLLIPILDAVIGEDNDNPPEEWVEALSEDPFYRRVVYALIPVGYASFIAAMWFLVTQGLPLWANLVILLGLGIQNGTMITLAHELGHKTGKTDRLMAKIALGAVGYGHFTVEHNLGHHKNVSTPKDCSSAKMGESVYHFATRDIPGALRGAWAIEMSRLRRRGLPIFSHHNEILQSYAITLGVTLGLWAWLGAEVLPWIVIHHGLAWFALSLVNYIEHYGLARQEIAPGRYEPTQPHHSWNTNHMLSNVLQIHLQRHSDHHTHPMRPYQALRSYAHLPRLP
ncbi:MAG: alkane 1-monooxygenase, partial [Pseudomonadota bacterium]